jgi:acetyl/propionyl-CoA carboxylase alpha subunit
MTPIARLLIANRGEVALRVMRSAAELGVRCVAVYPEDDAECLHVRSAEEARSLAGAGAAAYLDGEQILALARDAGCDALHPGYGFLSENAAFARRCAEAGVRFVGPAPEILELLGDKVAARALAERLDVPVLAGSAQPVSLEEARKFFESLGPQGSLLIKAVAGGGGRGLRVVESQDALEDAYARCQSEARAAFGNASVYVEERMPHARHVEVQIAGDGSGAVVALGERDCSIQRRHQKLVEIAPVPAMSAELLERIRAAALRMAREVRYASLGTFEFLVDARRRDPGAAFAFIEANPRLQVEHTVTEEVSGLDLVRIQLELAAGRSLAELGLRESDLPAARGCAIQVRINLETMERDGGARPSAGTLAALALPTGPGIRIDSCAYAGYRTSALYDSLLAKLIVRSAASELAVVAAKAERALGELRVEGVPTNSGFLRALLRHADFAAGRLHTRFIEEHAPELFVAEASRSDAASVRAASAPRHAGARIDASDPLAVLSYGQAARERTAPPRAAVRAPDGTAALEAPLQGTIVSIAVAEGDAVRAGQPLLVMESMKMEHEVRARCAGVVRRIAVSVGDTLYAGHPLLYLEEREVEEGASAESDAVDLDAIRPDLREVMDRHARTLDAARPEAVARRRATGQRTARENVDDLCDPGSFLEYGGLVVAAQRRRRSLEELIDRTPADGLITGVGTVNGALFPEPASRCAVMAYDYTVLAGTQGGQNHRKSDRMIDVAGEGGMPLVLFAEGGGGRPGDTDGIGDAQSTPTFANFATLSGAVPLVGITSGRCFAGNASLLGCCDVIIATADANIGMGGPAMIEGGGLGVFAPEEIGPMDVQVPNGVVDIAVADEAEAVRVAKRYLGYFQGAMAGWEELDQRRMRGIVPENRLRVYSVREVIETLADRDSVLELRSGFGAGMVTSLVRVEGRPLGIVANNPMHLGGAIDSDGSDKAARFMQLCDAFDLPLLFLCDTPGIMVGPEVERSALVRHSSRMFLTGANLSVPFFTIVLRKSYGLGALAMAGGSFKTPLFAVSWPSGEFGGMGLEGSVKLGYRAELAAIQDPDERRRTFDRMVAAAYERGKALSTASLFGVDDTIDPADSRRWVASALRSVRREPRGRAKRRSAIDAW